MIDRSIPYYNLILKCTKICTKPACLEMNIEKYLSLVKERNCRVVLETKTIDGLKQSVEWLKGNTK